MRRNDAELEAEIVRLVMAEKWRVGTVAHQLGVHHSVVRRVLRQAGLPLPKLKPRPCKIDPFMPLVIETLEKYPTLPASNLWRMLRERGFDGGHSRLREIVSLVRPRPKAEAYLRLSTLPGEQAQVDWAHFGTMQIGRAVRKLLAFVVVLSFSRKLFFRFFLDARMPNFLRGHVEAFDAFGGVPRHLLYDNLKSAVLERVGDAIRFNPVLLQMAAHYRTGPRAAAPGRGNEKGGVERAIRFIRGGFFLGREVGDDLVALNEQAAAWCRDVADARRWRSDSDKTVAEAFEEERASLLPLPDDPFPCVERVEVAVGKQPYVRFDRNDYSVPHTLVRRDLVLLADLEQVRICDGAVVVSTHGRSWNAGQTIEDNAHIRELVEHKRAARRHRGMNRLRHAAPASERFLQRAAERGRNLGSMTAKLLELLDEHGGADLDAALAEVLQRDVIHVPSVRQLLEQRRHAQGRQVPLPVSITDPRLRRIVVRPHDLSTYDRITKDDDDETEGD